MYKNLEVSKANKLKVKSFDDVKIGEYFYYPRTDSYYLRIMDEHFFDESIDCIDLYDMGAFCFWESFGGEELVTVLGRIGTMV